MGKSPQKPRKSPSKAKKGKTKLQLAAKKKRAQQAKKKAQEQARKKKLKEKKRKEQERKKKMAQAAKEKKKAQREKKKLSMAKKKRLAAERKKKAIEKEKLKQAKMKKKMEKANKPKRARSAYTFFVSANRSKIQKRNPEWNFKDLAKAVAAEWKKCVGKEREHYERLAKQDKERSENERENFRSRKPKRAMSAYMFFVKENRRHIKAEHPDMTFAEVGKALGHAWKHCDASHRKKYVELAAKDKKRAERERAEEKEREKEKELKEEMENDDQIESV